MKTALKKIGNSRGFTIPTAILDELGWTEETPIEMDLVDGTLQFSKGLPAFEDMLKSVEKALPDYEVMNRQLRGSESSE